MDTILVLVHTEEDGALPKSAFEAVTAAKTLAEGLPGSAMAVGVVGANADAAVAQFAASGATKFYTVTGVDFERPRYGSDTAAAEAVAKAAGASIVVAPASSRWSRVMSGVAYRLGGQADTHITGVSIIDGAPAATRWYYRQRMMGTIQRSGRPWVLTTDPGAFAQWKGEAGQVSAEAVPVTLADSATRTTFQGAEALAANQQTIRPDADLLFVAGAGWTKKQKDGQPHVTEAAELILGFLGKTAASLGGSKSIVDQSGEGQTVFDFMTHMNQVGQTGSTPRHPKGLATCCHGEEPHVVGWRFINERRAVNLDANCGWAHGKADVLYVADAFEVMQKVNELLSK